MYVCMYDHSGWESMVIHRFLLQANVSTATFGCNLWITIDFTVTPTIVTLGVRWETMPGVYRVHYVYRVRACTV